jgi:hypothetical protein
MRDEKDPGMMELSLARRRGRPPKNGKAMSAAERMQRYRISRRVRVESASDAAVRHPRSELLFQDCSDVTLVDALRAAMAAGDAKQVRKFCDLIAKRYQ